MKISPPPAIETRSGLDSVLQAITAEFAPQTDHETFLVRQMAEARWRLASLGPLAQTMLNTILADSAGNPNLDALAKMDRLAASAERSYRNAHKDLLASRKSRAQTPASKPTRDSDAAELEILTRPAQTKSTRGAIIENTQPTLALDDFDYEDAELELLTRPVRSSCAVAAGRQIAFEPSRTTSESTPKSHLG